MAIDFEKRFLNLKCTLRLERDGSPEEFRAGSKWLRQFAGEVLRDNVPVEEKRGKYIYTISQGSEITNYLNRRAREIEGGE